MTQPQAPTTAAGDLGVVWTDESGRERYVPLWAPERIVSLAVLRFASATTRRIPAYASVWHPSLDA
jgi:hypothetical protein